MPFDISTSPLTVFVAGLALSLGWHIGKAIVGAFVKMLP